MKIKKRLLFGLILIILILLVFNFKINNLKSDFDKYCIIQYNVSDKCPCIVKEDPMNISLSYFNSSIINSLNSMNISKPSS